MKQSLELCGSGFFTLPKWFTDFIGLTPACDLHDRAYVRLRRKLFRMHPYIHTERELQKIIREGQYKVKIKHADELFFNQMKVKAKEKGVYYIAYPFIVSFKVIVKQFGWRVWYTNTKKVWQELKPL